MHIEVLVEDSSGKRLLEILLPKIIGPMGEPHTWRLIAYKGIGRIPHDLAKVKDPQKRILLHQLPRLLGGYSKTPGIDKVLIVLDSDDRDCKIFLQELKAVAQKFTLGPETMFRLAIEEIESWYLADRKAIMEAYPRAKKQILDAYEQDSVCGTWEVLANAVHHGGSQEVKTRGWPSAGQLKHEWAERMGPLLQVSNNQSTSFSKFRDGLRRLVAAEE